MEDKKNYQKPTVKVVELKKKGYLLSGSVDPPEDPNPYGPG